MTIEQLARMVKRGFDQTATKDDLFGPLVRMVATQDADMRNLRMRVDRLERKVGFTR